MSTHFVQHAACFGRGYRVTNTGKIRNCPGCGGSGSFEVPTRPAGPGDFYASHDGWGSLVMHTSARYVWCVRVFGDDGARRAMAEGGPPLRKCHRSTRETFHALYPQPLRLALGA